MSLYRLALVLNASYEPINVVPVRRAIALVMKGAAIVQESSKVHFLRTARMKIPVPSVVRLLVYRNVPRQSRAVSRRNIMIRDGHRCQYCGKGSGVAGLSLDHVLPRSRGGRATWENLVACCHACNNRKGDRTPDEAGMTLLKRPARFGLHAKQRLLARDEEAWGKYLFV